MYKCFSRDAIAVVMCLIATLFLFAGCSGTAPDPEYDSESQDKRKPNSATEVISEDNNDAEISSGHADETGLSEDAPPQLLFSHDSGI